MYQNDDKEYDAHISPPIPLPDYPRKYMYTYSKAMVDHESGQLCTEIFNKYYNALHVSNCFSDDKLSIRRTRDFPVPTFLFYVNHRIKCVTKIIFVLASILSRFLS